MKTILTLFIAALFTISTDLTFAQNVGDQAPDFTLNTLNGAQFQLSKYKGKVVFIFFFGYGCPHCIANGPNTQDDIYLVYKGNTNFIAVGVDTWDGNEAGVDNFKSSTGVGYTLCLKASSLEQVYNTTYDRIVVVDKDGFIRFKSTANSTSDVVAQAKTVIDTYLAKDAMTGGDGSMDMMGDGGDGGEGTITGLKRTDNYQNAATIFPNPAKTVLNIETGIFNNSDVSVSIFDATGKRAIERKFIVQNEESVSVPVEQLSEGMYILQISTHNQNITKKFLVLR